MRALPAVELLDLWEAGLAQPRWAWAQQMLGAAYPELTDDALAEMTVGERDARLSALREAILGPQLSCRSHCPACGEPVEMTLSADSLRVAGASAPAEASVRTGDCEVRFRVPNNRDLGVAAHETEVSAMREVLLERCVLAAERGGVAVGVPELSAETMANVLETMSNADPQADVRLELKCPGCGQPWSEVFDIVSYFWAELDAWAQRLLHDVHRLASVYGWREADVLALSQQRRTRYLEMIES